MTEESMVRLGFAFMLLDAGWPVKAAAAVAFSLDLPAEALRLRSETGNGA